MSLEVEPYLRVPVGHDAHRWRTFHGERTVAVAARTVTSAVRVLEVLPALLRDDSRVTVVFAYDSGSAFNAGVLDLLHDAGCRVMPWSQLATSPPDLILTASENIDVPEGDCPVLVLPHGIGFQKFVPDSRAPRTRLSGVVPDGLLEAGRAWLSVSHPDQERQLLAAHPKTAGHTLLAGDPCLDELALSAPHAASYRRALGVGDDQRLIVLSSTWGPSSLIGQQPRLPARLLAELPYDGYRLAAILHPNVWAAHGAWHIRTLQAEALEAGLLLMPTAHAWRAALVAADAVVGDHGSVTLYGAALGKPVLLAAFGADAVPGTAVAQLRRTAPALDQRRDTREQIESAIAGHTAARHAEATGAAFAEPGLALGRLRTALYQLLGLSEPDAEPPPAARLPLPDPPATTVTSWLVESTVTTSSGGGHTVAVRRFPASVASGRTERADTRGHLACTDDEPDTRLAESASVVLSGRPAATTIGALRWIEHTLDRFPGSLLAATAYPGGGYLVGLRDGRIVTATVTGRPLDVGLPAAVVYTCLRAGIPLDAEAPPPHHGFVSLRVGDRREEDVVLRLRRPAPDASHR